MNVAAEYIDNPKYGIMVWRNALPESLDIVGRLERTIGESTTPPFMWMDALVGDQQKMPEYRDCVDFKVGEAHVASLGAYKGFDEVKNIYNDTKMALKACLNQYESIYNIKMDYMEAINYVRYRTGQHFGVHSDHGFSYNCTLSSCMYLNDDYEGGELWFPKLEITYKPRRGDIVMFPSTFIYAHSARAVTEGVKYSAVTMFDWNDRTHKMIAGYNYGKNSA
jgi:predicted 2-oxoglutarate/Fe(II)-dependent dioxygenase YbiX